jgi:hypothetical protein
MPCYCLADTNTLKDELNIGNKELGVKSNNSEKSTTRYGIALLVHSGVNKTRRFNR